MDISATLDAEMHGGTVEVTVAEFDSATGTKQHATTRTFESSGTLVFSGFAGQDGTREYNATVTLRTPDATRSPVVHGLALAVSNRQYRSHWRLAGIPIDGHTGPETSHVYGSGYPLEVWLSPASDSPAGAWPDHRERYRELLRYQNHAGAFDLHELVSDRVAFTETHSAATDLPHGSLLVALRPAADQQCGRGMWCLISGFEDMTMHPEDLCRASLELTFVAPLADYSTHAEAYSHLATEGI